jgi:uncharacterized membrane protein YfhO
MSNKKSTPVKQAIPVVNNTSPDFFEKAAKKSILIAVALIVVVSFIAFKDFILLNKVYLFKDIGSDTVNAGYPYFYNFAEYFHKYGMPSWSFKEAMGQNIAGGFLRDPFMLLGYFAGSASIPKIFIFTELIKIIASGAVFYLLLKQLKVSNFSSIIGSLLFSFSGFMIIGSSWYVFTYEAFSLALLLLGFELYFQKNKWLVFVIAIFLIGISMPFDLFLMGIFLLFYILFRLGQTDQLKPKLVVTLILKLCLLGLIGLLLSAPFLLESIVQILESPRGSGTNSYYNLLSSQPLFETADRVQFGTSVMRLFSSNLLGVGNDFAGWQNYLEASMSYCGIISIILMPQVFALISKSAKKWYIIWLLIWILPNIFPYFRHALWLFSGDYYRLFSLCVSLVFIFYSVFALDLIIKNKKFSLIALAITLVLSLILLNFDYFDGAVQKDPMVSFFVYASLVVYSVLLFLIAKPDSSVYLKYALLLVICIELAYMSGSSVNDRVAVPVSELSEKTGYNDYSVEAINYIKKNDKSFYRIDKDYYSSGALVHKSLNDNKVQDYYGTSSYSPFANNNYINYLKAYGIIGKESEAETRWSPGLISRPFLQSLNQVKYILIKSYTNPIWHITYDSVAKFGDVIVLKSKFTIPFGFTYKQYVTQVQFDSLSNWQKDVVSFNACIMANDDLSKTSGLKPYDIKDTIPANQFTSELYNKYISALSADSLKLSNFTDTKIAGHVISTQPEMMYLSFPYDKGWHLKVDGQSADCIKLNNGMTGIYFTQGTHQIELNYKLQYFYKGFILLLAGLLLMLLLFIINRKGNSFMNVTKEV